MTHKIPRPDELPQNAPSVTPHTSSAVGPWLLGGSGWLVVLLLVGGYAVSQGGCKLPWPAPAAKVTAAYYVYEKDDGEVPSEVRVALDKLNREKKILAEAFEDDTVNGDGETPLPYRPALKAAQDAGEPALVVLAGERAVRVVKKPTKQEHVLEAVP